MARKIFEWNVYRFNRNEQKIELFNIFSHGHFREEIEKHLKRCRTKEEFTKKLDAELKYYFGCRAEYELIIEITDNNRIGLIPWCGCREPEKVRIDVTDIKDIDWSSFAEYYITKQVYGNIAKIDVHDQVVYMWDEFVDYVWNAKDVKLSRNNEIQRELEKALAIFAEDRLKAREIKVLSARYAAQYVLNNEVLGHKGINWYAKEILKANKIVPKNYSWSHMEYQLKRNAILTEGQKQEIREAAKHEIVFDEDCPEITEEKFRELKEKGLVWRNRYAERINKKTSSSDKEN